MSIFTKFKKHKDEIDKDIQISILKKEIKYYAECYTDSLDEMKKLAYRVTKLEKGLIDIRKYLSNIADMGDYYIKQQPIQPKIWDIDALLKENDKHM